MRRLSLNQGYLACGIGGLASRLNKREGQLEKSCQAIALDAIMQSIVKSIGDVLNIGSKQNTEDLFNERIFKALNVQAFNSLIQKFFSFHTTKFDLADSIENAFSIPHTPNLEHHDAESAY
ncbi:hypothetical protein ACQZV8_04990 [Magnetococcales bacterium HHB-1]